MKLKEAIERLNLKILLRKIAFHHTACTTRISPHITTRKPNKICVPYHFCYGKTGEIKSPISSYL